MRHVSFVTILVLSSYYHSTIAAINSPTAVVSLQTAMVSLDAPRASYTFVGNINTESAELYHYFLQLKRQSNHFSAHALLIDNQTKKILIDERHEATIQHPKRYHWQVNNIFLRFNPINSSWIFGVDNKKCGFNLKVDTLNTVNHASDVQHISNKINRSVNQTGQVNGHIKINESVGAQFVTAKKSWFEQLWSDQQQSAEYRILDLFCEFNDGHLLNAVKVKKRQTQAFTSVSFSNPAGLPVPVSQFVGVEIKANNTWLVDVALPKMILNLVNLRVENNANDMLVAAITQGDMPAFCIISHGD